MNPPSLYELRRDKSVVNSYGIFMDSLTQKFYSANSAVLAERYDSCSGGISDHRAEGRASFAAAFPSGFRILDVGCGSGRDLRMLHDMGFQADGVDPCEEFVNLINDDTSRATALQAHGIADPPQHCIHRFPHLQPGNNVVLY